jgi:hypothetical protein
LQSSDAMEPIIPEPTKIGRFTIWAILGLLAIVVIALLLAFGREGTGEGQPPEPVRDPGVSRSVSLPLQA